MGTIAGLWFSFWLLVAVGDVISGSSANRHHQIRQGAEQRCDLICPGQPVHPLPPNFIQSCLSQNIPPNAPWNATTVKPPTTEESEEESDEDEDSNQNGTNRNARKRQYRNQHHKHLQSKKHLQTKGHPRHHQKIALKKQRVVLKKGVRSGLFRSRKGLKERLRLDGCYVICSEPSDVVAPPLVDPQGGGEQSVDSEEDNDNDKYVEGEDQPIEIVYVPNQFENAKRPSEICQHGGYELPQLSQEPLYQIDPEPVFWEGKSKKTKKRKLHFNEKSKNKNEPKHHA